MEGREGLEGLEESPEASRRDPDLVAQSAGEENQMKQFQETPLTRKGKSFGKDREASASAEERLVVKRASISLRYEVGTVIDSINPATRKRRKISVKVSREEL